MRCLKPLHEDVHWYAHCVKMNTDTAGHHHCRVRHVESQRKSSFKPLSVLEGLKPFKHYIESVDHMTMEIVKCRILSQLLARCHRCALKEVLRDDRKGVSILLPRL